MMAPAHLESSPMPKSEPSQALVGAAWAALDATEAPKFI